MSRFETVMISRARTEKISTLEQEFEAELKQLGKENAKGGKSLTNHISRVTGIHAPLGPRFCGFSAGV